MGEKQYGTWTSQHDEIILEMVRKAKEGKKPKSAAFVACTEHEIFSDRTPKAVEIRFYAMHRKGLVPLDLLERGQASEPAEDSGGEIDVLAMINDIKKVIKERDDYKFKYESMIEFKAKYEDAKKKLSKIEREFTAFSDLLKGRG